ncbi:hypothetical protein VQH23_25055 [Pararoseomonas sp. SCSIO 73927]|uniref:hypothetical protein n=1 Tax=Pararoseomonas sp. SCSIO 73927 TaxID=3114537 RepID=UPI0030D02546
MLDDAGDLTSPSPSNEAGPAGRWFGLTETGDSWLRGARLTLRADGSIGGVNNRAVRRWAMDGGTLLFLDHKGERSASFEPEGGDDGRLRFVGRFLGAGKDVQHRLEEYVRVSQRLEALPEVLRFDGEFGEEVNSFIPYVHWLQRNGEMAGRRIDTYAGMEPFYFFLEPNQIVTEKRKRGMVRPSNAPDHFLYPSGLYAHRSGLEWAPDYRGRYATDFRFGKPILVVHNKYTVEWGGVPHNYLREETLERIFSSLKHKYQIVFFEAARASHGSRGYSEDRQGLLEYNDVQIAQRHPEVLIFGDMLEKSRDSYNLLKLKVFASAYHFITTQGGNAHMCALFPGSMVAIQHIRGAEFRYTYQDGIFQFLANPRPLYFICKDAAALHEALPAFEDCARVDDRVHLGPQGYAPYERYRPVPGRRW